MEIDMDSMVSITEVRQNFSRVAKLADENGSEVSSLDITNCPCPQKTCKRNGDCDACRTFHADRNSLTRCQRNMKKAIKTDEKT